MNEAVQFKNCTAFCCKLLHFNMILLDILPKICVSGNKTAAIDLIKAGGFFLFHRIAIKLIKLNITYKSRWYDEY